jgi:hypothetical protein
LGTPLVYNGLSPYILLLKFWSVSGKWFWSQTNCLCVCNFPFCLYFIVFTFTHICIQCLAHSPSPSPHQITGRTCCTLLFSNSVEEKTWDNEKDIVILLVLVKDGCTEILSFTSMHMSVTIPIGSSLPDLFTTSSPPSHSGLCQFKITIFTPLRWAHQPHSSFKFPSLSLFFLCTLSP